ncbi:MAG: outer membrane protein assembly factor BamA [Acidobacteriota bacterium]|jgi:outer membrane protein insertion porin family|nr:outer membrane protein assembly factor BamA [Acidobacteriota bacterium]NLT33476.1 outer membrane protein assembly factor BamA [Acidobacteriota bacterium]
MARTAKCGICIIGFLLLGLAAYAQQTAGATTVERVDIRGNRRIPEDTIRASIIQTRPGEPFDVVRVEFDLRSLYRTNYFENLEVQEKDGDIGKIVTFIVKEKPLIRSIEYSGNKSFTESDILEVYKEKKLGFTVDSQYDPVKIKMAERVLRDLLLQNGKPLGTVRSEVENIPPYSVRVRFTVDEGANVRIGQIRFTGHKVFSDKTLKNALSLTKERNVFTIFKGTDKYHREKLEYDIETNLKAFYKQHGYMQVQVGTPIVRIFEGPRGVIPMLRKTREQFFIEIPIDAGDQYRLGKLELKECGILNCEALARAFEIKPGDVVNFKRIQDTLEEIKKLYGNLGHINFSYLPEQNIDFEKKTYDLTLTMQPDKSFFVRRINFLGNTKTRDKVMRREFILEEGKVFSSAALDNSVLRLNQLGFFDRIEESDYQVKPDEKAGSVDVDVTVKEKSQQSIGFTGGVSGISGSFIGLNYSTNNFLGRGESLEVSIMGGTRQTNFIVSFMEPYLLDTRWRMGVSVFNQRYRYDTYSTFGLTDYSGKAHELFTQRMAGATISLDRRLSHSFWTVGTSYTYQKIGVSNIAPGFETFALGQFTGFSSKDASDALEGIIRSEISPYVRYSSVNAYFNATRGTELRLSASVAGGAMGGDFNMIRPVVEYRRFITDRWLSGGRNVFAFNVQFQYIQSYGNSSVPFFDRFFIGGENTIRGFDIRSISPIAVTSTRLFDPMGNPIIDLNTGLPQTVQSQPFAVGGDTVGILNFEYRIPVAGPLSIAAFYDLGLARASRKESLGDFGTSSVDILESTNNTLRGSTGLELQFILPVVSAPFRLIFAYNPQRLDDSITTTNGTYHINEPKKDIKFTIGRSF